MKKALSVLLALTLIMTLGISGVTQTKADEPTAAWSLDYTDETTSLTGGVNFDSHGVETSPANHLLPMDSSQLYNGKASIRYNVQGTFSWWITMFNADIDLTEYEGWKLQFAVKGNAGGEKFKVGFKQGDINATVEQTASAEWEIKSVPLADLISAGGSEFDESAVEAFVIHHANTNAVKFWIADVRLVAWELNYTEKLPESGGSLISPDNNIEKSAVNHLLPTDGAQLYNGKPSTRVKITGSPGYWLVMLHGNTDLTKFAGWRLQFAVKGAAGGESFKIGFKKGGTNAGITQTATSDWTVKTVAVDDIIDKGADLADGFILMSENSNAIEFWIADVRLVAWDLNYSEQFPTASGNLISPGDNIEKSTVNNLLPMDGTQLYNGKPSIRVKITGSPGYWLAMLNGNTDLTNFAGWHLQYAVKGAAGGEAFKIGFKKGGTNAGITQTATADWTVKTVAVDDIIAKGADLADGFILMNENSSAMEFWLADIKLAKGWALDYSEESPQSAGNVFFEAPHVKKAANGLLPLDAAAAYNESPGIKVEVTGSLAWWIAIFNQSMDLTEYEGKSLQFALKGNAGGEKFNVGFKNGSHNAALQVTATTDWVVRTLGIDDIIAAGGSAFTASSIDGFIVYSANNNALKAWIADVKIIDEEGEKPEEPQEPTDPQAWVWNYSEATPSTGGMVAFDSGGSIEKSAVNQILPMDSAQKYQGDPSVRVNVTGSPAWWIIMTNETLNLTQYTGWNLEFAAKGETGGEKFKIGFKNGGNNAAVEQTLTTQWAVKSIPISDIIAAGGANFNSAAVDGFVMHNTHSNPVKYWIADVKLVKASGNPPNPPGPTNPPGPGAPKDPEESGWKLNYEDMPKGKGGVASDAGGSVEKSAETDWLPIDNTVLYNGKPTIRLNVTGSPAWWIAMIHENIDLSKYKGWSLQVAVKGDAGGERFNIGFKQASTNAGLPVEAAKNWKVVTVKVDDLLKAASVDPSQIDGFVLFSASSSPLKVWLADIRLVSPEGGANNPDTGRGVPLSAAAVLVGSLLAGFVILLPGKKRKEG